MKNNFRSAFALSIENDKNKTYELFEQAESSIFLTTSAFKIQTYKKNNDRKAKACVFDDENNTFLQDHSTHNDDNEIDIFFSFNNLTNYDLTL